MSLTVLSSIPVPRPRADAVFEISRWGKEFKFAGLKALLGAADITKAGDRGAGLAARTEGEREAARQILSDLTLEYLYEHPLTDERGEIDSVMRVNYEVHLSEYQKIRQWRLGEFKDWLLKARGEEIASTGRGLTGVMAAAVAKLMDVHELIYVARKIQRPAKARTVVGLPGTLSSRLQPNHPIDDLRGVTLLTYAGLSMSSGDALIGLNPAIDTVKNISQILRHLDALRQRVGAPTQICVLAHIKTQLQCLEQGAPVEILFQSLAGTESTNSKEFDITVDLLDAGYETMRTRGPLAGIADNFMYFETGQGSEYTYGRHNGIDMTTTEALCYGLARRYRPFMVNNVTGFIGPETHLTNFEMILSNLQDHFMGKLLGLPMGMAPCYTLHSQIDLDGQQMASQLLASAGANYYMDVCFNTDRMLAYFDTSAHDNQTLREIHGRSPAPEYSAWAMRRGILKLENGVLQRGPTWGDATQFCSSQEEYRELADATPSWYADPPAGPRPSNAVSRQVRGHQSVGRAAIYQELDLDLLTGVTECRLLTTRAADKSSHLSSPSLGAELSEESLATLSEEHAPIQIVISDGLSGEAVHSNIPDLLPVLLDGIKTLKLPAGRPSVVRYGRVKVAEAIAQATQCRLIVLLLGERPGGDAEAAKSLSAYFLYHLKEESERKAAEAFSGVTGSKYEYSVISNIYSGGLPPVEAASVILEKAGQILQYQAAGNRLETLLTQSAGHS